MNQTLETAMLYRALGLFVIPLAPHSKTLGFELADQIGFLPHLTDRPSIADIDRWFEIEPNLNIGIRLAGSGLTVVDVDDFQALALWETSVGPLPDVPRVETRKGMHYFFKASEEDHCGVIYHGDYYVGDFLTPTPPSWRDWDRAYVVAPPSVHPEEPTFHYEWVVSLADRPLVRVPEWIRAAVIEPIEPSSWWDYGDTDEYEEYERIPDCPYCGGEFWDGGMSCTCGDLYYGDDEPDEEEMIEGNDPGELPF